MTNNSNVYENEASSVTTFNWRQPSQLFNWIKYLIKNPVGASRQIAAAEVFALPLAIIAMNITAVFIASIICVVAANTRYSFYLSWLHIPLAGVVTLAVLMAAVFDFGFAGLLFVSTNIIFGQKTAFSKMLSMVSCKVAIDSLFILVGSVFMFISSFLLYPFIIVGNIISFTVIITVYNEEIELSPIKKLYGFACPVAVISVIMLVLFKAISSFIAAGMYGYMNWFQM